jgi:hypothetical protein
VFSIYWGQVSADSDGPVEWCKPVPSTEAEGLAAQFPELTLRVEPAHREAYVDLGSGGQTSAAQWQLADEALRSWSDVWVTVVSGSAGGCVRDAAGRAQFAGILNACPPAVLACRRSRRRVSSWSSTNSLAAGL